LRAQLLSRGAPQAAIDDADEVLSPDILTIGFGRRFASYKRATLLIHNPERLVKILNDPERPVQIIYAGKAHPHDDHGKQLVQSIIELARRPEFRRRIVFLENYDVATARYMLQGSDVWLNTPLRPQEASGTSGMKALANGVLNLSTLDGWWDEAWEIGNRRHADIGWTIGHAETYSDPSCQDEVESEALYDLLEGEIVPAFYERRADGLPRRWIARMKSSIAMLCPEFNMHRMVKQYTNEYYLVAHNRFRELSAQNGAKAMQLAAWLSKVENAWPRLRIDSVDESAPELALGASLQLSAKVFLDTLTPEDVTVESVVGRVRADGELTDIVTCRMQSRPSDSTGSYVFHSLVQPTTRSGMYGFAIRVLPRHVNSLTPFLPGLILWAGNGLAQQANSFAATSGVGT
jgi:starch phosphorylase